MKTSGEILEEILNRIINIEKTLKILNLWYPDTSGEWVENTYQNYPYPKGLLPQDLVDVMTRNERNSRNWDSCIKEASKWNWTCDVNNPIVAYKVVNHE